MKKQKNNGSAKRFIIILSLSLALLMIIGVVSFAWIRNYVDVDTLEIKSGKMLYNFKLYRASDLSNPLVFFDTNDSKDSADSELDKRLEREINNAIINIEDGEEVFFVVEKYNDSIDFDIALSFDKSGLVSESFENIGQMNFAMFDDSAAFNESGVSGYFAGIATNENKGVTRNLGNIWNTVQKSSVWGDQQYSCIRLKLNRNADVAATFEDNSFPFRIGFCIAQKGALPEEDTVDRYIVDNSEKFKEVIQTYGFNDEIYITQDVEYTGDLVFTRPCTITLIRSKLNITGNLMFSYMYGGKFTVNTVSDGHIIVGKNNGSGGNFRIDLPDTTIELAGANNDSVNTTNLKDVKADIYVEGNFTANASKNEDEGLLFRGSRICNINVEDGVTTYTSDLKPLLINGSTRMSVSNRTKLGELSVNTYCNHFILENNGYISKINLSGMTQDMTMLSEPSIFIDNAGTVADSLIVLPNWSKRFVDSALANKSADDNTHIIANKGSGELRAVTADNLEIYADTPEVIAAGTSFFSTGKKGDDGLRDDIDYMLRTQFVETIDGDKTKIVIHYETPSPIILAQGEYADLADLNTLKDYVDYYAEKGDIASVEELTEVKIVCYGDKSLTAPPLKNNSKTEYETGLEYDYNFIKKMTAVTSLDLIDAVSEGKRVPNNAFKNMSNLADLKMSESDTVWGQYIFTGTAVDEITFPQSLTKLDNPRNSSGSRVTAQTVLDGIRYVHTSIYVVDGFFLDSSAKQYLFTPDQYTYDAYRNYYNDVYWHSKIFLDVDVVRFGEYFLRLNTKNNGEESTCEFVVFTGGLDSSGKIQKWVENEYNNCGFDFQKIIVDGKSYKITSYDPYALFEKLIAEEHLEVVISKDVTSIGERAFACYYNIDTKIGLESVVIEGNPEIKGNAFSYNDALLSFKAPELTTLKGGNNFAINNVLKTFYAPKLTVVEGNGDISGCPALERVDIGVIQRTNANKGFYTSNENYSYAKFYIHTDNAKAVSAYTSALAADYRHIFVNAKYAKLYRATATYTGVTDMGENDLNALIAADEDGNNVADGDQIAYYYVLNGNEAHLVACMLSELKVTGDHTIIPSFDNGKYPVTYIGSAAYHFTAITAENIIVPDGVEEIGNYAFDSKQPSFKKYCITLDLKNVVKAGTGAFYYMDMARIVGDYLEEVAANTLSYNQNLIVANLPNLSRSRPAGTENSPASVFLACNELRISYTGASEDIVFDNYLSRQYNYVRFINAKHASNGFQIADVNTVVQGSATPLQTDFWNNVVNVDNSFSKIHFSDYYYHHVSLDVLSADIRLPGYIFYEEDDGELTLFSVSPDIDSTSFGDFGVDERNYVTPNFLYLNENSEYTSKDNGSEAKFAVTKLGKHAYGVARMKGLDSFTVADNITVLDAFALSGSAYDGTNGSEIVTLFDVYRLDLANVTEVGTRACARSNMVELDAPLLKKLGSGAFAESSKLAAVYLPNYEVAEGTDTFRYCTSLVRATLGKNATNLAYGMFDKNDALLEIVILNDQSVIELSDTVKIIDDSNKNDVTVSVPAAIYQAYKSKYTKTFGNIPPENFKFFGASTVISNITYYWNVIDETEKTAYINYIEGSLPAGSFTIPSTLDGYTVVSVTSEAMAALSDVTKVILPANMEYLSFTAADLTDKVTALEISASNSKFSTVDGVLYSKDGTTLLVYPKAKATINVTLADTVTEIGYRAFYGSKKLKTLTINGVVTVRDQAFESSSISNIKFTNAAPSIFAGRDILLDANTNIVINIPTASLDAYKSKVLIDYSIIEKFVGA